MLKGTLDDFTLPDMFRLMSLAKKTGRMDVVRQAGTGKVFFHEGDVYYAESSLSKEPLGRKLVRSRALTESQLNKALDLHAQTGERVGSILVNSGMVTAEQIETAVQQQIEDAIFDLLRWDLGEFSWDDGAELAVEVPIGVSVENLIMEASRRLDELEVITRKIPSAHAVLTMAPAPPEGAAEINITPDEWRVLVLVDGGRTVEDIGIMSGLDEFETMRMLYGLVSAGLIELDPEATEAALEAAAGEPAAAGQELEPEPEDSDLEPAAAAPEPAAADPERDVVAVETVAHADDAAVVVDEEVVELGPAPEAEVEPAEIVDHAADPVATSPLDAMLSEYGVGPAPENSPADDSAADPAAASLADEFAGLMGEPATDAVDEVGVREVPVAAVDQTVGTDPDGTAEAEAMIAPEAPPAEWFDDPQPEREIAEVPPTGADAEHDPFLSDILADEPEAVATPHAPSEAVSELPEAPPEAPAPPSDAPPAPHPVDAPSVDRAAVVRELAGLFEEERPRPKASSGASPRPKPADPNDQRKRVEDDDQLNKSLVSRLIKGVKGL